MITKNQIKQFIIDTIENLYLDDTLQLDNETTFEDCNMDSLDTNEIHILTKPEKKFFKRSINRPNKKFEMINI